MALGYDISIRAARLDAITTRAGANAVLRIYSGSRPTTGGTATTLLAELTCGATFAPAAASTSNGNPVTLTLNAINQDPSANSTGTAAWFRIVKSDGTTFVLDGNCGTSGSDLNLTTTSIVSGQPVSISSFTINEGNA